MWWWHPSSYFHCIITLYIHTHTYTSNHKHTSVLLCSKLTGRILGLRAPWGSILAVLSLKTPYLHSVSYLSSVHRQGKGKPRAYYFIGWQNNIASFQLKAKGYGLWFRKELLFFYLCFLFEAKCHCKSRTQIKPVLAFSVVYSKMLVKRVCFTLNREGVLYNMWPCAICDHENMAYSSSYQAELGVLSSNWILSFHFVIKNFPKIWH